jgi:hypothetical protein
MNKFAFFFPAKIVFAEANVELTPYEGKHPVYLGPIGRKYYFKTDKNKIVFEHIEDDKRQLFVKVRNCFCPFHVTFIDNIPALMESVNATCDAKMAEWEAAIDFPEVYEQKAAEAREKAKTENAIRDAEIQKQKQERFERTEQAHKYSVLVFKNGEMIEWPDFERACKERSVKLPIKTLGFGRANVSKIGQTGYSISGSKHNSPVLWAAIRELAAKLVN